MHLRRQVRGPRPPHLLGPGRRCPRPPHRQGHPEAGGPPRPAPGLGQGRASTRALLEALERLHVVDYRLPVVTSDGLGGPPARPRSRCSTGSVSSSPSSSPP